MEGKNTVPILSGPSFAVAERNIHEACLLICRDEAHFTAAKLEPHLLVRRGEAAHIPGLYKYQRRTLFPSKHFLCPPSSPVLILCHFFFQISSFVDTMAPKKIVPTKQPRLTIRAVSSLGRQSGSTTSRFASVPLSQSKVFQP